MPTVDGLRRRVDKLQQEAGAGGGEPVDVTVHHVHAGGVEVWRRDGQPATVRC